MTGEQIFPEPFSRLLLVEGDDDKAFFLALTQHLKLSGSVWIYSYEGRDQLDDALIALVNEPRFELLNHLGIVRDSDFNTDAFSSVCSRIRRANRINPRHQLPVPERALESSGSDLKTSILILPNDGIEGMLEDLILKAFEHDPAMLCADDFFRCLENSDINSKREVLPKAKTRVFLAGKAVDERNDRRASEAWELQYIFRLSWWSWDNPTFDQVKAFLQKLATV